VAFDISRFTFDPWKNFSSVVMEQGRVQLDSDWNERDAELARRIQAGTLDIMGQAAYPATTPAAFLISGVTGPVVLIGCGRMYVDGLLAENHGEHANAQWDPALAEMSGAPQPPVTPPNLTEQNSVDFLHQPYLPGAALPSTAGFYLFYLDVWTRPVTFLEDKDLIDKAVGVDTTGRLQTVWQVKWIGVASGATCATPVTYPPASGGRLTTNVVPLPNAGPCCLTTGNGYTGVENQCYRVEIHQAGKGSDPASTTGATFKWSRDNASVATAVTAITDVVNQAGNNVSVLTVTSLGRDQVLGFFPGDWIEILDDWSELWGSPGIMCQIDSIDAPTKTITLTSQVPTNAATTGDPPPVTFPLNNGLTYPHRHTRIVKWNQSGTVYQLNGTQLVPWCDLATTGGLIRVPASDTALVLENGITVTFSLDASGNDFNVGDFWIFDARTADGSVEILNQAPPVAVHHHYTKLAIVNYDPTAGSTPGHTDCRTPWGPGGEGACGCCCVATVGKGGQFATIQAAIDSLTGGGEVCVLPGVYLERVTIFGRTDVVIRGCGAQTRVVSPSTTVTGETESGLSAVITVVGSQNVRLCSFAVKAGEGDVGILLDSAKGDPNEIASNPNADITIEDLVITASAYPAIAAVDLDVLKIADNRIAMEDVASSWAAIYTRGTQMRIERNWIGLQDAPDVLDWIPVTVATDLSLAAGTGGSPQANGGIQIAGSSQDVLVSENEIVGGSRNGITLGSYVILDDKSKDTRILAGLIPPREPLTAKRTTVAGPGMQNIQIARNRIRNMGFCGIGPAAFFDLATTLEVISIENLAITDNVISSTLQGADAPSFGYGAVAIPDVQNLIVRDNVITDFGAVPGAQVCGIYVLMGELVEISGNQILETRDWSNIPTGVTYSPNALQAGIMALVTPPALDQGAVGPAWASSEASGGGKLVPPVYQPGVPALRVENNVVRVPLGLALDATGYGPFSILGNHFTSGGTLPAANDPTESVLGALTVLIVNLGRMVELDLPPAGFSYYWRYWKRLPPLKVADSALATSSSGAVLFANNICQLEARASGAAGFASVFILSLDQLTFSNNHCWLDAPATTPRVGLDAFLLSPSLNVCGNRFQEAAGSVYVSGVTFGPLNITAQNISTYCLFVWPPATPTVIGANNVEIDTYLCPERKK
jgi:hypothetical protein